MPERENNKHSVLINFINDISNTKQVVYYTCSIYLAILVLTVLLSIYSLALKPVSYQNFNKHILDADIVLFLEERMKCPTCSSIFCDVRSSYTSYLFSHTLSSDKPTCGDHCIISVAYHNMSYFQIRYKQRLFLNDENLKHGYWRWCLTEGGCILIFEIVVLPGLNGNMKSPLHDAQVRARFIILPCKRKTLKI